MNKSELLDPDGRRNAEKAVNAWVQSVQPVLQARGCGDVDVPSFGGPLSLGWTEDLGTALRHLVGVPVRLVVFVNKSDLISEQEANDARMLVVSYFAERVSPRARETFSQVEVLIGSCLDGRGLAQLERIIAMPY